MSINEVASAQNDQQVPADKAERKRRKKEKKLLKAAQESELDASEKPIEETANADDAPNAELDSKAERKRRKKEKKLALTSEQAMDVDDGGQKSEEKKRKKRKHETIVDESTINTTDPETSGKRKKKRKDATEVPASASTAISTTGHKKKQEPGSSASPEHIQQFLAKHSIKIDTGNSEVIQPVLSFDHLDVPDELRSSFSNFKEPTPIQACTWPPALKKRDVIGIAETGSGKTLAFGIPALCKLVSSPKSEGVTVLVVAPTRELALQTHETLSELGKPLDIASVAIFGGVPKDAQIKMLKKAGKSKGCVTKIVVGTPGRILDLVNDGACDLSSVDYLVLDEADRMLDKGFENDIRNIISYTKQGDDRQTMMFSATWPEAVRRLASTFLRSPVRVTVGSDDLTANSRVEQAVEVFDDARSKDSRLLSLLRSITGKKQASVEDKRILIFALYKKEASRVEQMLSRQGYSVGALHGDMAQSNRIQALEAFKTGGTDLLVATDVAARGLDIPNVSTVVNYTFPLTIEDYIHRIGRTGRGGKTGKSITYFTGDNHERSLAGELARVLRESGFECEGLKKFPMTIKKKEHGVYGAFFRDDIPTPKGPTKITFD